MSLVDVHVITLGTENREWLDECMAALEKEPVNIHIIKGVEGDTSIGRLKGFSTGKAPFVSFVDPDDVVVQGAFEKALTYITPECVGVYTDEILIDEKSAFIRDGSSTRHTEWSLDEMIKHPTAVHHLVIGKRDIAEKCFDHLTWAKKWCEWIFHFNMAAFGPWQHAEFVGYKWRMHPNNDSKLSSREYLVRANSRLSTVHRELLKSTRHQK